MDIFLPVVDWILRNTDMDNGIGFCRFNTKVAGSEVLLTWFNPEKEGKLKMKYQSKTQERQFWNPSLTVGVFVMYLQHTSYFI